MSEKPNWNINNNGDTIKISGSPFSVARDVCAFECRVKTAKGNREGVSCSGVGAFGRATAKISTKEGGEYFDNNAKCLES